MIGTLRLNPHVALLSPNFVSAIQPVFIVKLKPLLGWLLLLVPIAIVLRFSPAAENPTALFTCSAIDIIPLAGWMRRATEALSARMGGGAGGLRTVDLVRRY